MRKNYPFDRWHKKPWPEAGVKVGIRMKLLRALAITDPIERPLQRLV
jgi:hypothetical protein